MWDVIIIGGGPAGLTSGVYCARKQLKTLVLATTIGGQVAESSVVENYLGYNHIDGVDLAEKFKNHLTEYTVKLEEGVFVEKVEKKKGKFLVHVKGLAKSYSSKSVIIATGAKHRLLGVPGESKFLNKGVVFCAWCDAPLFKDKVVAVVGGGNSGLEAAVFLEKIAKKIFLVNITGKLTGDKSLIKKVVKSSKIDVLNNTKTLEVVGDSFVSGLIVKDLKKDKNHKLEVSGVFVEVGMSPVTSFVKGLVKLNKRGEILINERCETSVPGLFSAGDCSSIPFKQIVIAAGEGAKAGVNCGMYLDKL